MHLNTVFSLCNSKKTKDLLSLSAFTDASVISWHECKTVVCRYLIGFCLCLPQRPLRGPEFYTGEYYLLLQRYDVFPNPNMWLCCGRVSFLKSLPGPIDSQCNGSCTHQSAMQCSETIFLMYRTQCGQYRANQWKWIIGELC